ncbi:MAG TPA: prepilin-type N-terminal cleavage/methylation domain-containing protein [Paucimonas sp.]|nr:prepilin-type N-terminal cleavage/methylation domain-containing protein [Paucimonas sp.]
MIPGRSWRPGGVRNCLGVTLVELVVTLVIIGILAAVVMPRLIDRDIFEARGFYDQTMSMLRYAQKTAVAQRRNVCVAFTSTSLSLTIAAQAGSAEACTENLRGPDGNAPYAITAPGNITYTTTAGAVTTPAGFTFSALGQAVLGANQVFRVSGFSRDITIERETGYVH